MDFEKSSFGITPLIRWYPIFHRFYLFHVQFHRTAFWFFSLLKVWMKMKYEWKWPKNAKKLKKGHWRVQVTWVFFCWCNGRHWTCTRKCISRYGKSVVIWLITDKIYNFQTVRIHTCVIIATYVLSTRMHTFPYENF